MGTGCYEGGILGSLAHNCQCWTTANPKQNALQGTLAHLCQVVAGTRFFFENLTKK